MLQALCYGNGVYYGRQVTDDYSKRTTLAQLEETAGERAPP